MLTPIHLIGIIFGSAAVILTGILSGVYSRRRGISTTGTHSLGTGMVTVSMIGVATGGASTVGTAQLAYTYGLSAWWFSLGMGLSFLLMLVSGIGTRLYNGGKETLAQYVAAEYGRGAAVAAAVFTIIGSFLTIISNLLAGVALLQTISDIGTFAAGVIVVIITISYILFGGMRGSAATGTVKCLLMYSCCICCAVYVLSSPGGFSQLFDNLPHEKYFSLLARGAGTDLGAGLSIVLGIMTTQTYFNVLLMARSLNVSRRACLLCGILLPPIGLSCILVGQYMALNAPGITAAASLPLFILQHMPAPLAGFCLGALLITTVGPAAGLSIGISTIVTHDIYKSIHPNASEKTLSRMSTVLIAAGPLLAMVSLIGSAGSLILSWSFLSIGLRGATIFAPLLGALFFPGKIQRKYAVAAVIVGPMVMLLSKLFLSLPFDPVFPGVFAALIIMGVGLIASKNK